MAGIAELNMNWYFKKRISFFVLVYYLQSSWQRIKSYPTVCFFSSSRTTWAKAVWAKTYFLRKSNTHSKENLMMFFIVLVSMPPSIYTVFWYSCMFAEKISTRIPTIPAWPWLYVILHKGMQLINQCCLRPTSWQIGSWQFSVISKPVPIFLRANVLIDLQFLRLPTCCRFLQTSNLQPVAQPPCSDQRWPVADFCNGKEFFLQIFCGRFFRFRLS